MTKELSNKNLNNVTTDETIKNKELEVKKTPTGRSPIKIVKKDGAISWGDTLLREPHQDIPSAFQHLTATMDTGIACEIITRAANAQPDDGCLATRFSSVLETLADAAPKDSTEARLTLQAATLYSKGMDYFDRAEKQTMLCHSEHYMKHGTRLLRLHNETIDALTKYRRGGEQRVVVQHVNVSDSSQAIINNGTLSTGGGLDERGWN